MCFLGKRGVEEGSQAWNGAERYCRPTSRRENKKFGAKKKVRFSRAIFEQLLPLLWYSAASSLYPIDLFMNANNTEQQISITYEVHTE